MRALKQELSAKEFVVTDLRKQVSELLQHQQDAIALRTQLASLDERVRSRDVAQQAALGEMQAQVRLHETVEGQLESQMLRSEEERLAQQRKHGEQLARVDARRAEEAERAAALSAELEEAHEELRRRGARSPPKGRRARRRRRRRRPRWRRAPPRRRAPRGSWRRRRRARARVAALRQQLKAAEAEAAQAQEQAARARQVLRVCEGELKAEREAAADGEAPLRAEVAAAAEVRRARPSAPRPPRAELRERSAQLLDAERAVAEAEASHDAERKCAPPRRRLDAFLLLAPPSPSHPHPPRPCAGGGRTS